MTELTSITRHVGSREDPYADNPDFWLGSLAASIHGYLNDRQSKERLEIDYHEFMGSPACSDELREILGES